MQYFYFPFSDETAQRRSVTIPKSHRYRKAKCEMNSLLHHPPSRVSGLQWGSIQRHVLHRTEKQELAWHLQDWPLIIIVPLKPISTL